MWQPFFCVLENGRLILYLIMLVGNARDIYIREDDIYAREDSI